MDIADGVVSPSGRRIKSRRLEYRPNRRVSASPPGRRHCRARGGRHVLSRPSPSSCRRSHASGCAAWSAVLARIAIGEVAPQAPESVRAASASIIRTASSTTCRRADATSRARTRSRVRLSARKATAVRQSSPNSACWPLATAWVASPRRAARRLSRSPAPPPSAVSFHPLGVDPTRARRVLARAGLPDRRYLHPTYIPCQDDILAP